MVKAVLRNGAIIPTEPLPSDWEDGTALEIAKWEVPTLDIDAWLDFMNQLCADSTPEDEAVMRRSVDEQRQQARTQARRDMGLAS